MVTVPEKLDATEDSVEIVAGTGRREDVQGGDKSANENGTNGVLDTGHGSSRLRWAARRAKGQSEEGQEEEEMVEEGRKEKRTRERASPR